MKEPARARSELYGLLSELLSFPTERLAEACREGELETAARGLVQFLPQRPGEGALAGLTDPGMQYVDLQSEYIRLFDVPGGGLSVPLYAGVFAPSRSDSMEELLRFYRHFGLTVSAATRDLPDAIPTVLEFLQLLAWREATIESDGDVGALQRAQRDVLKRHLLVWTVTAVTRIEAQGPLPFYRTVIGLLHEHCTGHATLLAATSG